MPKKQFPWALLMAFEVIKIIMIIAYFIYFCLENFLEFSTLFEFSTLIRVKNKSPRKTGNHKHKCYKNISTTICGLMRNSIRSLTVNIYPRIFNRNFPRNIILGAMTRWTTYSHHKFPEKTKLSLIILSYLSLNSWAARSVVDNDEKTSQSW